MTRTIVSTVAFLALACPLCAQPSSPGQPSIDQLIDRLTEVRTKRNDLDRQERDVAAALRDRLREQLQRLQQLGVVLDGVPPPPVQPPPVQPPPLPPPVDPLSVSYQVDRAAGLGDANDLRVAAAVLRAAGEHLDKSRPAQVEHLRVGVERMLALNLRGKLPSTFAAVKAAVASGFGPGTTAMEPAVAVACKTTLLSLAARLEKLTGL